jgi:outer membrane protein assembly factor BamB
MTSQGCVYQDQRRLVCCDAVTGEVRWSRTDVPAGCDLFGDDEVVFAVPAGETVARKFSAVDGRLLGESKVPPFGEQLATIGRRVLSWKRLGGQRMELASLDAHSGETLWRREFESGAAVDVDLGRYIAVVEPAGRALVIDGQDGALLVEQPVPTQPVVEEIHFTVGADTFLVVAKHRRPARLQRTVLPFNAIDSPVIDGQVYLFDRDSGEMRWGHPAEVIQQALLLNQPRDLPILAFAGTLNPDGGAVRPYAAVFVLDKRSGRTLYQSDKLVQAGQPQCHVRAADAAKPIAALELSGGTVLLQFTDKRRPPEPPALAEVEGDVGKSSRGIMGIIEGIAN